MRRIKLLTTLTFALFALTFYGYQWFAIRVSGRVLDTLSAPTGVTASDGNYSDKIGLRWDTIRGATSYRIFRNTANNSGSAADVGTTARNYFFDPTASVSQTYFYWVRAENGSTVSGFSSPDQGMRAVGNIVPGPFLPLNPPPEPTGNPVTAVKAYLGKTLFWDEQLSSTKTVSCGTCHRPNEGGSDPRTSTADPLTSNPGPDNTFGTDDDIFGSPGVIQSDVAGIYSPNSRFGLNPQVTNRKSPSYLNAGYANSGLFWDGRASNQFRDQLTNNILLTNNASLESQTAGPPVSPAEMAHTGRNWTQVAARIAVSKPLALASNIPAPLQTWINGRTYPQLFEEAFGTPDVTPSRISMAIATHERTLFSDQTPLDKWSAQIEPLGQQEERGRSLFLNLQCNACHDGALMTDHNFHNIGVRPQNDDIGRGGITLNSDDNGRFKTPTLRNVELRAPYMHNGRFATLEEVVEFYNRGGDFDAPNIDHGIIRPLNLSTQEKADLVAFLKRPLTDTRVRDQLPPFDRPQLYTESNRVPVVSGSGRAGSGGIVPNAIAIEPPLVGNLSFTVGVSNSLGGSQAVVVIDSADPGVGTSIPASGSFAREQINLTGTGNGGYGSVSLQIPNNPALIGQTFYGRWYVTDPAAANGFAVSKLFTFTVFGDASAFRRAPFDFDGDGKTDIGIFRPGPAEWWINRSSNGVTFAAQFGLTSDKLVPVDYTGDGKSDIAFFRPSTGQWFVLRSEDFSFFAFPFGANGDIPAPADYDGDGKADAAVFRPSSATWYVLRSSDNGVTAAQFGISTDQPVANDFDGDGKADFGVWRAGPGEWWILKSTGGVQALQFGSSTDKAVPGDYTGDGKADVAFFRPSTGTWFVVRSEDNSYFAFPFGTGTDLPAPGDYDGDGKFDAAVFRPSNQNWFVNRSSGGVTIVTFGAAGDLPVPGAFVR